MGSSDNDQPPPRMDSTFVPVMQSPRDTNAAMVAQLRPRPTFDPSRHAPPVDRRASSSDYDRRTDGRLRHDRPDDRMRQDRADGRVRQDRPDDLLPQARSFTSHSRRPDDRDDIDRLRQENAELRRQLASAQPSRPPSKSHAGHRDCDIKDFAGAADEPDLPTFSALRCSSAPEYDASDPDIPSSFEQALSSHYIDESPPWHPSNVQSMPRPHNMTGSTGFRQLPADYSNRYPQTRPF